MHHMYDETPNDPPVEHTCMKSTAHSDAIYNTHVGWVTPGAADQDRAQVDTSQYRQRGYKVGSLMTGPNDPDVYYKQPGHPLSPMAEKGGMFKVINNYNFT
jgi:hypothetical protein